MEKNTTQIVFFIRVDLRIGVRNYFEVFDIKFSPLRNRQKVQMVLRAIGFEVSTSLLDQKKSNPFPDTALTSMYFNSGVPFALGT